MDDAVLRGAQSSTNVADGSSFLAALLLGHAAFVLWIWGFVELCCLKGSRRTNQFGPDPLQPVDTPAALGRRRDRDGAAQGWPAAGMRMLSGGMTDTLSALSIARDLLRCPSVTPADAGALGVLETMLKAAGFDVHRVTFGEPGTADIDNLYARIGTAAPHLTFAGHTDVVPPGDESAWTPSARSPATSRTACSTAAAPST